MSQPCIAVFGSSQTEPHSPAYEAAMRLGALLAGSGVAVLNGGYAGLMEAVSRGAADAGGHVIGITAPAVFPDRAGANAWGAVERPHSTITERIHDIISLSDASITLPGSLGTLTELMAAWNTAFVARFSGAEPKPVLTVGEPWLTLVPELATRLETDGSLVTPLSTIDEAVAVLVDRLGL